MRDSSFDSCGFMSILAILRELIIDPDFWLSSERFEVLYRESYDIDGFH